MPLETELKLQIDPRHIARLRGHPLFKHATHRVSHKVHSVYYDTPDLDLWHAGITLRLRRIEAPASSKQGSRLRDAHVRESGAAPPSAGAASASRVTSPKGAPVPPSGGARWVQTIKGGGTVAAGLHQRHEFETAITVPVPDFSALGDSGLAAHFASPRLREHLKPVFVTEFTRISSMLAPANGVVIEASIDHGSINSGAAAESVCELELEVKTGPAWRAYQVAMQLLEAVPLCVEDRSKAERGVALHRGTQYKPLKAAPSPVAADMTTNTAFKALVLACLAHYTANQRGMLDGADPEYLHQMRVALRRLRSVFATFAPLFPAAVLEPPVAETRWLARILGAARDWDVFVAETLPPVSVRYAQHPGVAALTRSAALRRAAANRSARRAVASARGQGLLLALGAWINAETWLEAFDAPPAEMQRPVSAFAHTVLGVALRRVRKRGRHFANLAPPDLHRLRIAAKKLRYATGFFAPLHDGRNAHDYQDALARLQDELGSYNDAVKTTSFATRAGGGLRGAAAVEARGILLGWSAGMQSAGTRHLKRVWKEFCAAKPFWE